MRMHFSALWMLAIKAALVHLHPGSPNDSGICLRLIPRWRDSFQAVSRLKQDLLQSYSNPIYLTSWSTRYKVSQMASLEQKAKVKCKFCLIVDFASLISLSFPRSAWRQTYCNEDTSLQRKQLYYPKYLLAHVQKSLILHCSESQCSPQSQKSPRGRNGR